jgi:transposase
MSLKITRGEHSIEELRRAVCRYGDSKQARRLLGLAMALEGNTRKMAATAAGMTRQTLRDWVIRYIENGVDGLKDKPRPGRRPQLNEAQLRELDVMVEKGPDIAVDGIVRWRCIDLKAIVAGKSGVDLSEDQIGRILKQQRGYTRLSVRPQHPQADQAAQEAFKKISLPS